MCVGERPLVIMATASKPETIFGAAAKAEVERRYELLQVAPESLKSLSDITLARARYMLGRVPSCGETLERLASLRAVFDVEGDAADPAVPEPLLRRGIQVLTTSAAFAEPLAERGLAVALERAGGAGSGAGVSGLAGDESGKPLAGSDVGLVGFGDLGRALSRLLSGFRCRVRVYDPELPAATLTEAGVAAAPLATVLAESDTVFVLDMLPAGYEAVPRAACMRPGASLILLTGRGLSEDEAARTLAEADLVGVDGLAQQAAPAGNSGGPSVRFVSLAHGSGGLDHVPKAVGRMILDDMALMDQGLKPLRCRRVTGTLAYRPSRASADMSMIG